MYVYDGYLMEILREKGSEQDPEFGEMVCPAQMLEAETDPVLGVLLSPVRHPAVDTRPGSKAA